MKTKNTRRRGTADRSRRSFMKQVVLGAGATAAALGTGRVGFAAEETGDPPITIPQEFDAAKMASCRRSIFR